MIDGDDVALIKRRIYDHLGESGPPLGRIE